MKSKSQKKNEVIPDTQTSNEMSNTPSVVSVGGATNNPDKTPEVVAPSPIVVVPKWYQTKKRFELKKELIKKCVDEYSTLAELYHGITYKPSKIEIAEYASTLKKASLKELANMGEFKKADLKLDILDRLKSVDKKKHAVVTIFNDNKTTDTGVVHCYDRTFSREGMRYIIMTDRGVYNPEFKMTHFYYYANNPFPIVFDKTKTPDAVTDGKLLDNTIEFHVIEALANIAIDKKINIALVLLLILVIEATIILIMCAKGFKVV